MRITRPQRGTVLLLLASTFTGGWGFLELLSVAIGSHPPDYGLLGVAAPMWAAWAALERDDARIENQAKRSDQIGPENPSDGIDRHPQRARRRNGGTR